MIMKHMALSGHVATKSLCQPHILYLDRDAFRMDGARVRHYRVFSQQRFQEHPQTQRKHGKNLLTGSMSSHDQQEK
jgi:hypothetical protein